MKNKLSKKVVAFVTAFCIVLVSVFTGGIIDRVISAASKTTVWDFENSDISRSTVGLSTYLKTSDSAFVKAENAEEWVISGDNETVYGGSDKYIITADKLDESDYALLITDMQYREFELEVTMLGATAGSENMLPKVAFGITDPTKSYSADVLGGYTYYFDNANGHSMLGAYHIDGSSNEKKLDNAAVSRWNSSDHENAADTLLTYTVRVEDGSATLKVRSADNNGIEDSVVISLSAEYEGGHVGILLPSVSGTTAYGQAYKLAVTEFNALGYSHWDFEGGEKYEMLSGLTTYKRNTISNVYSVADDSEWQHIPADGENDGYIISSAGANVSHYGSLLTDKTYTDFELTARVNAGFFAGGNKYNIIFFGVKDPAKHYESSADAGYGFQLFQNKPFEGNLILYGYQLGNSSTHYKRLTTTKPDNWSSAYNVTANVNMWMLYTVRVEDGVATLSVESEDGVIFASTAYNLPSDYDGGHVGINFISQSNTNGGRIYDFAVTDLAAENVEARSVNATEDISVYAGIYTNAQSLGLPETVSVTADNGKMYDVDADWDLSDMVSDGMIAVDAGESFTINGELKDTYLSNGTFVAASGLKATVRVNVGSEVVWNFEGDDVAAETFGLSTYVRDTAKNSMKLSENNKEWNIGDKDGFLKNDADNKYIVSSNEENVDCYSNLLTNRVFRDFEIKVTMSGNYFDNGNKFPRVVFGVSDPTKFFQTSVDGGYGMYFHNNSGKLVLERVGISSENYIWLTEQPADGYTSNDAVSSDTHLTYTVRVENGKATFKVESADNRTIIASTEYTLSSDYAEGHVGVCIASQSDSDYDKGIIYEMSVRSLDPTFFEAVKADEIADIEISEGSYASVEDLKLPSSVNVYDSEGRTSIADIEWDTAELFASGAAVLEKDTVVTVNGKLKNTSGASFVKADHLTVSINLNVVELLKWDFEGSELSEIMTDLETYKRNTSTNVFSKVEHSDAWRSGTDGTDGYIADKTDAVVQDDNYLLYTNERLINFEITVKMRGGFYGGTGLFPSVIFGVTDPTAYYRTSVDGGFGVYMHNTNKGRMYLQHYQISGSEHYKIINNSLPTGWDESKYYYPSNTAWTYTVKVENGIMNVTATLDNGAVISTAEYALPDTYQGGYVGVLSVSENTNYDCCQIYYMSVRKLALPDAKKAISVEETEDIELMSGEYSSAAQLGLPKSVSAMDIDGLTRKMNISWDTSKLFEQGILTLGIGDEYILTGTLIDSFQSDGTYVTAEGLTASVKLKVVNRKTWDFTEDDLADAMNGFSTYIRDTSSNRYILSNNADEWDLKEQDGGYIVSSAYANQTDYGYLLYTDAQYTDFELEIETIGNYISGGSKYPTILFGVKDPTLSMSESADAGFGVYINTGLNCRTILRHYLIEGETSHQRQLNTSATGAPNWMYASNLQGTYKIKVEDGILTVSFVNSTGEIYSTVTYPLPADYTGGYVGINYHSQATVNGRWDYGQIFNMSITAPYSIAVKTATGNNVFGAVEGEYSSLAELGISDEIDIIADNGETYTGKVAWNEDAIFDNGSITLAAGNEFTLTGTLVDTTLSSGRLLLGKSLEVTAKIKCYDSITIKNPAEITVSAGQSIYNVDFPKNVEILYNGNTYYADVVWNYTGLDLNTEGSYKLKANVIYSDIDGVKVYIGGEASITVNVEGSKEQTVFDFAASGELNAFVSLLNTTAVSRGIYFTPAKLSQNWKTDTNGITFTADDDIAAKTKGILSNSTSQIGRLVYTERSFTDFELTVEMSAASTYYPMIEFGLTDVTRANGRLISGYRAYTDDASGGKAQLTGSDGLTKLTVSAATANGWTSVADGTYTLTLRVQNGTATLIVIKGGEIISSLITELGENYRGGYIALASGVGSTTFKQMRIVDLAESTASEIISVELPAEITFDKAIAAEQLALPEKLEVEFSDGSTEKLPVVWFKNALADGSLAKSGSYKLKGMIVSSDERLVAEYIELTVTVKQNGEKTSFDFNSAEQLNQFDCYYSADGTALSSTEGMSRWKINEGRLCRINESFSNSDTATKKLSSLVYTAQKYTDFELNVDVTRSGNTNWWAMIGFAVEDPTVWVSATDKNGAGGAAVFVNTAKQQTLLTDVGETSMPNVMFENNFSVSEEHHIRLVVLDGYARMFIDDYTQPYTVKLAEQYRNGGYISLMSNANEAVFDNLTIMPLSSADESTEWRSEHPEDLFGEEDSNIVSQSSEPSNSKGFSHILISIEKNGFPIGIAVSIFVLLVLSAVAFIVFRIKYRKGR